MTTIDVCVGPHAFDPENPYTDLLLDHPRINTQPWTFRNALTADILHLMWPELVTTEGTHTYTAATIIKLGTALAYRSRTNRPTVWTIHNTHPHRTNNLTQPWLSYIANHTDAIAVHHPDHAHTIQDQHPNLEPTHTAHTPHGHYANAYAPGPGKHQAREHFNLPQNANVAAYVGTARPYKGVHQLATIRPKTPSWHYIAGGRNVERYISPITRTRTLDRFLTPHELATILDAADICILPYLQSTNSGAALLALTHKTPLLLPNHIPAFHQLQQRTPPNWVHLYPPRLDPHDLHQAAKHLPPPEQPDPLPTITWDKAQTNLLTLYDNLLPKP